MPDLQFPGFLGNESVKRALDTAFSTGRFPHAVILQGERGSGKRTLAALLARALVCRNGEAAPCGECPSCLRAQAGSHPDIKVVEGGGASKALTVESVRWLVEDAVRMPEEAAHNVYILHLGERTLPAAQNKLLKLIEEPPEGCVFIMLCPTAEAALPTIRSRAQIFTLRPPEQEDAARWIAGEKGIDPGRARELAALCGGNLGRMQEELEGGEAGQAMTVAADIAGAMLAPGVHRVLKAAGPLQKDRVLFRAVLERLGLIFRDACVLRAGAGHTALMGGAPELADKLSGLPMERLAALPGLTEEYRQKLDRNANTALLLTCFCGDITAAASGRR